MLDVLYMCRKEGMVRISRSAKNSFEFAKKFSYCLLVLFKCIIGLAFICTYSTCAESYRTVFTLRNFSPHWHIIGLLPRKGLFDNWTGPLINLHYFPVKPEERPQIVDFKARHRVGDILSMTCLINNTFPAANLTWFVTGKRVSTNHAVLGL